MEDVRHTVSYMIMTPAGLHENHIEYPTFDQAMAEVNRLKSRNKKAEITCLNHIIVEVEWTKKTVDGVFFYEESKMRKITDIM